MKVDDSKFRSTLDKLYNIVKQHQDGFSSNEWEKVEQYFKWLRVLASQFQKKRDKKFKDDRNYDPNVDQSMDYVGDSELMDDFYNPMKY